MVWASRANSALSYLAPVLAVFGVLIVVAGSLILALDAEVSTINVHDYNGAVVIDDGGSLTVDCDSPLVYCDDEGK